MADDVEGGAPPGIAALPPTTVLQIGSHRLLTDPSSVVKELIDNALDARARSVFVDITANTIDTIQVKDDGHGIPSEDRALACRRYCTSKIRDLHDLKEVGGKWLGFRGEALASIADMSSTVSITTRVEGEPVAVKLTYQRNGELTTTERDSHPVGTTVRVTKLLESTRVRKDLAIKGAAKCLGKIRRLMQAYALARPAIQFRLHILKAKNNKSDFVYAPKANANVEDAALKITGKECALQCEWTALELDSFELQAFLPTPIAVGSKVANYGAFISVDSRPMSSTRGTLKKVATAVRDRLRKANTTLANVRDPFFCINIVCPIDSYDPNIEPAKDDVIFGDENFVLTMAERLLVSYYPENINSAEPVEDSDVVVVIQSNHRPEVMESSPQLRNSSSVHQATSIAEIEETNSAAQAQQPRWRSSMYGIDEENLEFLQETMPDIVEEEEGQRDAAIFNPWTIARMNAPIKPRKPVSNGQLLSPAKSQGDTSTASQSPAPAATPHRLRPVEPMTPLTSSQANTISDRLNDELQQSIQRLPSSTSRDIPGLGHCPHPNVDRACGLLPFEGRISPGVVQATPQASAFDPSFTGSVAPRRNPGPRQSLKNKPYVPPVSQSDDTWFGQPMRNAPKAHRSQKRSRQYAAALNDTFSPQRSLATAAERLVETRLASENATDIRNFFGKSRHAPVDTDRFARTTNSQPQHIEDQFRAYAELESPNLGSPRRPRSANSYHDSTGTAQEMDAFFQLHQNASPDPASSPIRRSRPSTGISVSVARSASRPRRRRTTDGGLHRTKSSTLPLNFVPHGFEIHKLTLPIATSVRSITQHARKLDMTANSLEWGYDSTDATDVFTTAINERKIMQWVVRIDSLLNEVFERRDGVEVRGALHEGIQRFLDKRGEQRETDAVRTVVRPDSESPVVVDYDHGESSAYGAVSLPCGPSDEAVRESEHVATAPEGKTGAVDTAVEPDEVEDDFDFAQFVHLHSDAARQGSLARAVKTEDDFGDGVDDEMLMDL